jgi:hypothetical protein
MAFGLFNLSAVAWEAGRVVVPMASNEMRLIVAQAKQNPAYSRPWTVIDLQARYEVLDLHAGVGRLMFGRDLNT